MRSRGQVLPMWILGVIATFSLMFLAMNYANDIRYQIRAQNAADSAAAAIVSVQAQRWNEMEAALYASNIEEYRFRKLLDAMLLSVDASGGCQYSSPYDVSTTACNLAYINQHDALIRSAVRYSADVQQLNDVTANAHLYWNGADDSSLVTAIASAQYCNKPVRSATQAAVNAVNAGGGDCGFSYKVTNQSVRSGLGNVMQDAQGVYIPSEGQDLSGTANENVYYFAPIQVEVLVCATVPPLIPQFGPIKFGSYVASARGAATDVMLEQDWLQPGSVIDSQRSGSQAFQPEENYTGYNPYDYYNVDFGGSAATAYNAQNAFVAQINNNELDARLGWWGPISITPYQSPAPSC